MTTDLHVATILAVVPVIAATTVVEIVVMTAVMIVAMEIVEEIVIRIVMKRCVADQAIFPLTNVTNVFF